MESNMVRYAIEKRHMHACRQSFVKAALAWGRGLEKRDLSPNINFFMNVPVESDGAMGIVDGLSKAGDYVDLRADLDVLAVISNCPQTRNPCNGFNPTPIRVIVREQEGT